MSQSEKKALRGRRRKRAIEELLSTEKTYVNLMSNLVEHYVKKLSGNTSMLSSSHYAIIFPSDIHAILGLNQTFLQDLTKVIESDTFNNHNSKIGDILYTFCPHFVCFCCSFFFHFANKAPSTQQLQTENVSKLL